MNRETHALGERGYSEVVPADQIPESIMLKHHQLSLTFDPIRLRDNLARVRDEEWIAHFNKQDYDGGWSGVSLRGIKSARPNILPGGSAPLESVVDMPVMDRCPYFTEVLRHFQCPIRSARLLRLCPGAFIREHRDNALGLEDGEVRFHVPILTNPDVAFFVDGERLPMLPGETWYIDFNLPHRVNNRGQTDRIHLVIDCVVNDWVHEMLPTPTPDAEAPAECPRCPEALQRFQAIVAEDSELQENLRDTADRELFVSRVVQLGASRGCRFAKSDVEDSLNAARRDWTERDLPW